MKFGKPGWRSNYERVTNPFSRSFIVRGVMKKELAINMVLAVLFLMGGVATGLAVRPDHGSGSPNSSAPAAAAATNANAYACTQAQNGNGAQGLGGSTATCSTNN